MSSLEKPAPVKNPFAIFVKGFPADVSSNDLKDLFGKLLSVTSVHFAANEPTLTGWKRAFAILHVSMDNGEGNVRKCVRKLNNCLWKGAHLTVEVANEYYKDRLSLEKEEEERRQEEYRKSRSSTEADEVSQFNSTHIRLRKNRGEYMYVSTQSLQHNNVQRQLFVTRGDQRKEVVSCGKRLRFEYNDSGDEYTVKEVELTAVTAPTAAPTADEEDKEGNTEMDVDDIEKDYNDENQENGEKAVESSKKWEIREQVEEVVHRPTGGGARKGFGTLLTKADKKERKAKEKAGNEDMSTRIDPEFKAREHGESNLPSSDDDDDDDDDDLVVVGPTSEFDAGDSDDAFDDDFDGYSPNKEYKDIPSVNATDVEDSALEEERKRALRAFQNLGGEGATSSVDGVIDRSKANNSKITDNRRFGHGWDSVNIDYYDPSAPESSQFVMDDQESSELLKSTRERQLTKAARAAGIDMNDPNAMHDLSTGDNSLSGNNNSMEEQYADLNQLKGIFAKDGGIWFGDDGGLKEQVIKGSSMEDRIFMEAEKFGLDIRSDKNEGTPGASSTGMTFNFFDNDAPQDTEGATNSAGGAVLPKNGNTALSRAELAFKSVAGSAAFDQNVDELPTNDLVKVAPEQAVVLDISDIIANAKRFCRSQPGATLIEQWKDSRDKLMLYYKRRRTDHKKRHGKAVETPEKMSVAIYEQPSASRAVKRPRGGKKHRKKV